MTIEIFDGKYCVAMVLREDLTKDFCISIQVSQVVSSVSFDGARIPTLAAIISGLILSLGHWIQILKHPKKRGSRIFLRG